MQTSIARGRPDIPTTGSESPPYHALSGEADEQGHLATRAHETLDRLVQVERTALPSFHWLQGTLGSGLMVSGLFYGAFGGGTPAEEVLARAAVVTGSHWYVTGIREVLSAALVTVPGEVTGEATVAAGAAIGAWVGLMAGTALLGSTYRPAQYSGLAIYHAAMMVAAACLRHAHTLACRRAEALTPASSVHRNLSWAVAGAAVIGCASIALGGTFWLTSRGSSVGALAAGGAGFHAIIGACRAMGLSQARALAQRRQPVATAHSTHP